LLGCKAPERGSGGCAAAPASARPGFGPPRPALGHGWGRQPPADRRQPAARLGLP